MKIKFQKNVWVLEKNSSRLNLNRCCKPRKKVYRSWNKEISLLMIIESKKKMLQDIYQTDVGERTKF